MVCRITNGAKVRERHERESARFVAFVSFRGFRVSGSPPMGSRITERTDKDDFTERGFSELRGFSEISGSAGAQIGARVYEWRV